MEPTIYYRKIPVSTPPEKTSEYYHTNEGYQYFTRDKRWFGGLIEVYPTHYLLPATEEEYKRDLALAQATEYRRGFVEGEQEQMRKTEEIAALFLEWVVYDYEPSGFVGEIKWRHCYNDKIFTTSELYNSEEFKEYLKLNL
jgi:hypothetical protein